MERCVELETAILLHKRHFVCDPSQVLQSISIDGELIEGVAIETALAWLCQVHRLYLCIRNYYVSNVTITRQGLISGQPMSLRKCFDYYIVTPENGSQYVLYVDNKQYEDYDRLREDALVHCLRFLIS